MSRSYRGDFHGYLGDILEYLWYISGISHFQFGTCSSSSFAKKSVVAVCAHVVVSGVELDPVVISRRLLLGRAKYPPDFPFAFGYPQVLHQKMLGAGQRKPFSRNTLLSIFAERGMVITPCPHVDKDGRLRLRVDLTGVKGGRGALWHDVLWVFSTTSRSLCLHERAKDFLLARGAASGHNSRGGARQDCKRFLPWARAPSEISARDKMISLWLDSARM